MKRTISNKQSGAALIIGMLLLLVLTLLAVTAMNTASTELTMAGNTQFQQNAFQAAEVGIAQALANGAFNPSGSDETVQGSVASGRPEQYTATISSQLSGTAQPALWGSSWDSFSTFHFEIDSVGTAQRTARANNVQGVAVIAPKDPTVPPLDPASPALTP